MNKELKILAKDNNKTIYSHEKHGLVYKAFSPMNRDLAIKEFKIANFLGDIFLKPVSFGYVEKIKAEAISYPLGEVPKNKIKSYAEMGILVSQLKNNTGNFIKNCPISLVGDPGMPSINRLNEKIRKVKNENIKSGLEKIMDSLMKENHSFYPTGDFVLSHGDIHDKNFVYYENKLKIIDLDSLCLHDPCQDIIPMLLRNKRFSLEEELLNAFLKNAKATKEQIKEARKRVFYREVSGICWLSSKKNKYFLEEANTRVKELLKEYQNGIKSGYIWKTPLELTQKTNE